MSLVGSEYVILKLEAAGVAVVEDKAYCASTLDTPTPLAPVSPFVPIIAGVVYVTFLFPSSNVYMARSKFHKYFFASVGVCTEVTQPSAVIFDSSVLISESESSSPSVPHVTSGKETLELLAASL